MASRLASLFAAKDFLLVAEKERPARMLLQPFLEDPGQKRREGHAPSRSLFARPLLFADQHRFPLEIQVRNEHAQNLAAANPGMASKAEQRVDPAMKGFAFNERKQLLQLRRRQIQALEKVRFLFRGHSGGNLPLHLLHGHEWLLFVMLGIDEAPVRERPFDQAHVYGPVPRGPE